MVKKTWRKRLTALRRTARRNNLLLLEGVLLPWRLVVFLQAHLPRLARHLVFVLEHPTEGCLRQEVVCFRLVRSAELLSCLRLLCRSGVGRGDGAHDRAVEVEERAG